MTITESLVSEEKEPTAREGLPAYTFQRVPGDLQRSRYDAEQNVIVINNGHRDFVYASRPGRSSFGTSAASSPRSSSSRTSPGVRRTSSSNG